MDRERNARGPEDTEHPAWHLLLVFALSALLFLYRDVLAIELPWMESVVRAKRARKLLERTIWFAPGCAFAFPG